MAEDSFWNDLAMCETPEEESKCAEFWSGAHSVSTGDEEKESGITISSSPDHTPTDIATSVAFSVSTWGG